MVCLGRFGLFGAKARSARVTEAPVGGVRVREGGGACRSRVRDGAARAVGGGTSGRRSEGVGREGPEIVPRSRSQGMVYFIYSGQPTL